MDDEFQTLVNDLCSRLDRDEWLAWSEYLIYHQAARIAPLSLAALCKVRQSVLAGLLEIGPTSGDTVH